MTHLCYNVVMDTRYIFTCGRQGSDEEAVLEPLAVPDVHPPSQDYPDSFGTEPGKLLLSRITR